MATLKTSDVNTGSVEVLKPSAASIYVPDTDRTVNSNLSDATAIDYMQAINIEKRNRDNYFAMKEIRRENAIPIQEFITPELEDLKPGGFEKSKAAGRTATELGLGSSIRLAQIGFTAAETDWGGALGRFKNFIGNIENPTDIAEGIITGVESIRKTGSIIPEDLIDYEKVGSIVLDMNKQKDKIVSDLNIAATGEEGFGSALAGGLSSVAIAMAVRNPAVIISMFGGAASNEMTVSLMDELGMDFKKARRWGDLAGLSEGSLEAVGVHNLIEAIKVSKFAPRLIKSFFIEASQEASQSLSTDIIGNLAGKEKEVFNILEDAAISAMVGGLTGATVSFGASITRLKSQGLNQEESETLLKEVFNNPNIKKAINTETTQVAKRIASNLNHRDGNPDNTISDIKSKLKTGEYQKQMFDIRDDVRKTFTQVGATKSEIELATNAYQNLANIAYEETGLQPREYYEDRKASIELNNIERFDEQGTPIAGSSIPDAGLIQMFKARNKTTLMHEFGHHVSNEIQHLNRLTTARTGKKIAMYEATEKWLGTPGKDGKFSTAQEEKFSNGFIKYLAEGTAPSKGMRATFNRIAKLFKDIYEKNLNKNIEINEAARELYKDITQSPHIEQQEFLQAIQEKIEAIKATKAEIRGIKAGVKTDTKKFQAELTNMIKDLDIKAEDKVKLINLIKEVNSERTLQRVSGIVTARAENYYNTQIEQVLSKNITKELNKGTTKLAAEAQTALATSKKYNKMSSVKAEEEYKNIPDEGDNTISGLHRRILESKILGKDESSKELYEDILEGITSLRTVGKEVLEKRSEAKQVKFDKTKAQLSKQLSVKETTSKVLAKADIAYGDLKSFLTTLGGKKFSDDNDLLLEENSYDQAHFNTAQRMKSMLNTAYQLSKRDLLMKKALMDQEIVGDLTNLKDNTEHYVLNRNNMITVYNHMRNASVKEGYIEKFGQEQLDLLLSNMEEGDVILADMILEYYRDNYAKANKNSIKFFNRTIAQVDNYSPIESAELIEKEDPNSYYNPKSIPNFVQQRSKKTNPNPSVNALDAMMGYDSNLEYLENVAEQQLLLHNLTKDAGIKTQIINKYGKAYYNSLTKRIDESSMNGVTSRTEELIKAQNKLIGNWVLSKIALNSAVFVKQLPSLMLFGDDIPSLSFYGEVAKGLSDPKKMIKYMTSIPFIEKRFKSGGSDAVAFAMETASRKIGKAGVELNKRTKGTINPVEITNMISILQRTGDTGAWIIGGYAKIQYLMKEKGFTEEAAIEQMIKDGLQNQQSHIPSTLSGVQKNPYMKPVLLFTNALVQFNKKMDDAGKQLARGEIDSKQYAKMFTLYRVMMPSIYGAITTGMSGGIWGMLARALGDDEKKKQEEYAENMLVQMAVTRAKGTPIINFFIPDLLLAALTGNSYGISVPIISDIDRAFRDRFSGDIDIKPELVLATLLDTFTGLPATQAVGSSRIIKDIIK